MEEIDNRDNIQAIFDNQNRQTKAFVKRRNTQLTKPKYPMRNRPPDRYPSPNQKAIDRKIRMHETPSRLSAKKNHKNSPFSSQKISPTCKYLQIEQQNFKTNGSNGKMNSNSPSENNVSDWHVEFHKMMNTENNYYNTKIIGGVYGDNDVSIYEQIQSNLRINPTNKNKSKSRENSPNLFNSPKDQYNSNKYNNLKLIENALGDLSIEDIQLSNSKKNVFYDKSAKLRDDHVISTVEDNSACFYTNDLTDINMNSNKNNNQRLIICQKENAALTHIQNHKASCPNHNKRSRSYMENSDKKTMGCCNGEYDLDKCSPNNRERSTSQNPAKIEAYKYYRNSGGADGMKYMAIHKERVNNKKIIDKQAKKYRHNLSTYADQRSSNQNSSYHNNERDREITKTLENDELTVSPKFSNKKIDGCLRYTHNKENYEMKRSSSRGQIGK